MIFVILGTQDKLFTRLIKEIESLKKNNIIKKEVVVQCGNTKYKSNILKIIDFMTKEEFLNNINKSDYIISHAGAGSIMDAIKVNKKVIVVPRLKKYGEHENDHQIQISKEFGDLGYIINCKKLSNLKNCILDINNFNPRKFVPNNRKMIDTIENYISNI